MAVLGVDGADFRRLIFLGVLLDLNILVNFDLNQAREEMKLAF